MASGAPDWQTVVTLVAPSLTHGAPDWQRTIVGPGGTPVGGGGIPLANEQGTNGSAASTYPDPHAYTSGQYVDTVTVKSPGLIPSLITYALETDSELRAVLSSDGMYFGDGSTTLKSSSGNLYGFQGFVQNSPSTNVNMRINGNPQGLSGPSSSTCYVVVGDGGGNLGTLSTSGTIGVAYVSTALLLGNPAQVGGGYLLMGSGSPQGVYSANTGDIFFRTDGGVGTTVYRCTTGAATVAGTTWTAIL